MSHLQPSGITRTVVLHRAPLAPAAAALTTGVVLGRFATFPTGFWMVLAGGLLLAAGLSLIRPHLRALTSALVIAIIASLGAVHARLAYFHLPEDHIVHYADSSPQLAALRGTIATAPQIYDAGAGLQHGYQRGPRTTLLLKADEIPTRDGWRPARGLVRVVIKEPFSGLGAGARVELLGRLCRFDTPDNPGQLDWAATARIHHCLARFTMEGVDGLTPLQGGQTSRIGLAICRLRAAFRQHLVLAGDEQATRLLAALLVGERDPALRTLNRAMIRSGVAHFLSISGLHLGVFLGFVFLVCRLLALSPRRSAITVLVVLGAYMVLAEPRAPLLRSALMAAALCTAVIFRRPHSSLNALAASGILLLAIDPLQLFTAAFQLSFVIVGGLLILHEPVERLLFGRWKRLRGLMVFRDEQRVRRWFYYVAGNWATGAVAMALTAYLVAAPLVAYHFGLFCPYAPVLSLVLLPLVLAVLLPGYVAMALAGPLPNLSHAVAQQAGWAANLLADGVERLAELPGMSFELRPVGVLATSLCYAVIWVVLARKRFRHGRLATRLLTIAAIAALAYSQRTAPAPPAAELHLLAVGSGQCAVLRSPDGQTTILDAGTQSGFDAGELVVLPLLRTHRLPLPQRMFISHANTDHFNALPSMLSRKRVDEAYVNDYFGRREDPAAVPFAEAEVATMLRRGSKSVRRLEPGQVVRIDARTHVEVLWPPRAQPELSLNDTSLVLRVTCDDRSVLLPGDLDRQGQAGLLASGVDLSADILVLPHHGAWRKTLPAFVKAVGPETVLVSSSADPTRRSHAREQERAFWRDLRPSNGYYSTARNGWICVRFGEGEVRVETMR
jgi:competence protein ComEC